MDATEFREHRNRILSVFHSNNIHQGVIVYESPPQSRERFTESDLPFIQDGFFFWLTGWSEAGSVIIIDISTRQSIFLLPIYPDLYPITNGLIPTPDSVINRTGVDRVDSIANFDSIITSLNCSIVYATPRPLSLNFPTIDTQSLLVAASISRRNKSPKEIECLRKAAQTTALAITDVLRTFRWHEGITEMEVEASFRLHGTLRGCPHQSFLTTVGAGANTCFLHYDRNSWEIGRDDLILLDCGVYFEHYAGDITRTFPASGKFSVDQATVYGELLAIQKDLIGRVKPGVNLLELEMFAQSSIFALLGRLAIIPKSLPFNLMISQFFSPHGISHHIGCNTHDLSHWYTDKSVVLDNAFREYALEVGYVISMEPGIYFHAGRLAELDSNVSPFEEIDIWEALRLAETVGGIRIEDDLLVTETGCEILSERVPKEIEEIERLMTPL
jgi:Xaa-Pro aminopeptidase